MLSNHFVKAGYRVIAVSGVMDAYEAFIRNDIDLILTDFVLRDKEGLEVIKTFRTKKSDNALPIVVFTAMQDEQTANSCRDAGANLVLAKSGGTSELLTSIEKLIEEYKANLPTHSLESDMGNCIVKATTEVFRTMMNLKVVAGEVAIEKAQLRKAEVIGSIGVAGFLTGSISVFMPKVFARRAVAAMLMLDGPDDVADSDLVDAVGELTNMVGGCIKTALFQKTPLFDISVPSVYIGEDLQRRSVSDDLCFLVPFQFDGVEFSVEFLMVTKKDGGTGVQQAIVGTSAK
ncbi:MAG: chemotaxis protein CheX [Planctomycetes bacterium]|nr:chemotaxis protein CheX [Planctomycetota bacterium]MCB9886553.1 chemotaxis protein CheX [Planctomycetota bacterium]